MTTAVAPHHFLPDFGTFTTRSGKASQVNILDKCSEFAWDSRAGEALVVQNNNNPKDALAQQVDLIDLTNFKGVYSTENKCSTGKKFILQT